MATQVKSVEGIEQDALLNYLTSMASAVEGAVNKSLDALLGQKDLEAIRLAGEVFRLEPRINEMETIIDDYAVRLSRKTSPASLIASRSFWPSNASSDLLT